MAKKTTKSEPIADLKARLESLLKELNARPKSSEMEKRIESVKKRLEALK